MVGFELVRVDTKRGKQDSMHARQFVMANVLAMVQTDCILQSENFSSLFTLGYVTRRNWVRVYVLFWVLINVVSDIHHLLRR
jgi:hypothetical protein